MFIGYGYGCGKSTTVNSSTNTVNANDYYSSQGEYNTYSRPQNGYSNSVTE